MANFFLDRVFSTGGDVQGGAVLYDQANYLDIYTDRDVERVEPGTEAPIVTGQRTAPARRARREVRREVPDDRRGSAPERRRRAEQRHIRRLSNTIVRKMHQRGLAELAAQSRRTRTASSISWSAAMALTMTTASPSARPARTFTAAQREAENNEFGYSYDTLIVNPTEAESFRVGLRHGRRGAADNGITTMISTPRKAAGSAYLLAAGRSARCVSKSRCVR
jgi:hypothetical protein